MQITAFPFFIAFPRMTLCWKPVSAQYRDYEYGPLNEVIFPRLVISTMDFPFQTSSDPPGDRDQALLQYSI